MSFTCHACITSRLEYSNWKQQLKVFVGGDRGEIARATKGRMGYALGALARVLYIYMTQKLKGTLSFAVGIINEMDEYVLLEDRVARITFLYGPKFMNRLLQFDLVTYNRLIKKTWNTLVCVAHGVYQ